MPELNVRLIAEKEFLSMMRNVRQIGLYRGASFISLLLKVVPSNLVLEFRFPIDQHTTSYPLTRGRMCYHQDATMLTHPTTALPFELTCDAQYTIQLDNTRELVEFSSGNETLLTLITRTEHGCVVAKYQMSPFNVGVRTGEAKVTIEPHKSTPDLERLGMKVVVCTIMAELSGTDKLRIVEQAARKMKQVPKEPLLHIWFDNNLVTVTDRSDRSYHIPYHLVYEEIPNEMIEKLNIDWDKLT